MAAPAWGSLSGANVLIWIGIALCITQSAILSGLNLAIFSISKLRLEVEVAGGNRDAFVLLDLRKDSNLTLATVLWGNVTINVLLTLLSDSVLAGVGAFVFSTIVITLFGEIIPQAYFSRNAIRMAALLAPLLRVYRVGLFLIAKPTAIVLNCRGVCMRRRPDTHIRHGGDRRRDRPRHGGDWHARQRRRGQNETASAGTRQRRRTGRLGTARPACG
jgi:CBS domain containing-hemolysin-like protein